MSSIRNKIDFVGHNKISIDNINSDNISQINNIIHKSENDNDIWIEKSTEKIGEWRAVFRTTYIAWAISINGLFAAEKRYSDPDWSANNKFEIRALRLNDKLLSEEPIAEWSGKRTAEAYMSVAPFLYAYGFMDLYSALEEFVFDMYRVFLNYNPDQLICGTEYRDLRRLRNRLKSDKTLQREWDEKWGERLDSWQRKHLYEGLDKVFLAYCNISGLEKPSEFSKSNPQTWSETIGGLSLLRNSIAHGVKKVTKELEEFSNKPYSMTFEFHSGDELA